MKILYVITRAEMGGSQTHLLDLLQGFRERHDLALATGEHGFLTEEAARLGVRVHVLPDLVQPLRPHRDIKALMSMYELIRRTRPDLVHCHTSKAGVIGRAAARMARVPAIFTAHTWSFAEGTSLLWKLVGTPCERLAARWSERIIAVSESNRSLALRRRVAPGGKIVTVHNGVLDNPLRARPGAGSVPRIVMVARFAPQKNQAQLIEALAGLQRPCQLTFVGDGPTRPAAEQLARSLGLQDRIEFAGVRTDTDRILSDSSIFVLATNWEGFPITILEAMRAGLPVVATDVDGVREAVVDGETGYLYPKGATAPLCSILQALLDDPATRIRLGQAGRKRYEAEFTRSAMIRKIASIYERVIPGVRESQSALLSA
jgi:glycosyltransferase involved in cell wall biosynthesis